LSSEFIKFLEPDKRKQAQVHFKEYCGIEHVVGAVDGCHFQINNLGGHQAQLYRNRRKYFSLNVQACVDETLAFADVVI
jgi:hypothetical protein